MAYLGSHIGFSSPRYYLGAVEEALSYGEDCFMFYTGAPQNTKRKPLEELWIPEGRDAIKKAVLDESKIVVHAPYIINLGNKLKPETFDLAKSFLLNELQRTEALGVKNLVLHPGSHVGNGEEVGMESLIEGLTEVLSSDASEVTVCLETMAGKGSEIGVGFPFFREFFTRFPKELAHRVAVCLDTCHVNDAGLDVFDASKLLDDFDAIIGLDKLRVVHLNDSKNPRGSHKDRHENLGYGSIGFEALLRFVNEPRLKDVPIILETPYVGDLPPYQKEISLLRAGTFEPGWREAL